MTLADISEAMRDIGFRTQTTHTHGPVIIAVIARGIHYRAGAKDGEVKAS